MKKLILRLKRILLQLIKFLSAGAVALIILSLFCFAFCFAGIHIRNESGATDYKWEPHQWKSTVFEGYAWLQMDEKGFNNQSANDQNPDILIMGSSHMEAVNIPASKNVASLMNTSLPMSVYNIGTSGHTIYTCIKNMDAAIEEYHPNKYVILETSMINLSISQMQDVLDGNTETIPSYDSGMLYLLQKYVPAIKTIYKNIIDWKDADNTPPLPISASASQTTVENSYEDILEQFLNKASSTIQKNGAKLIIFYHPKTSINEKGEYITTTDHQKLSIFKEICQSLDIIFIDMTEPFKTMYQQQHVLPHGFSNTAVGNGHLNEHGHRVIADTLIQSIMGDKENGIK